MNPLVDEDVKEMLWTPVLDPPDPSAINTLSSFAQRIINHINAEQEISNHHPYFSSVATTSHNYLPKSHQPIVRSEYFHSLVGPNKHIQESDSFPLLSSRTASCSNLNSSTSRNNQDHLAEDVLTDCSASHSQGSVLSNRLVNIKNTRCDLPSINHASHGPLTFNPSYKINQEHPKVNRNVNNTFPCDDFQTDLSPDMEFGDMDVYSFPHGGIISKPEKTFCELSDSNKVNQKENKFIKNALRPINQTFTFTLVDKNPTPTFKKKLANFKKANTKRISMENRLITNNLVQNKIQNKSPIKTNDDQELNVQQFVNSQEKVNFDQFNMETKNIREKCSEFKIIETDIIPSKFSSDNIANNSSSNITIAKHQRNIIQNINNNSVELEYSQAPSQCINSQFSEASENMFVKTQNFNDNLERFQEQKIYSEKVYLQNLEDTKSKHVDLDDSSSEEFNVENIFSLKDETLKEQLVQEKSASVPQNNLLISSMETCINSDENNFQHYCEISKLHAKKDHNSHHYAVDQKATNNTTLVDFLQNPANTLDTKSDNIFQTAYNPLLKQNVPKRSCDLNSDYKSKEDSGFFGKIGGENTFLSDSGLNSKKIKTKNSVLQIKAEMNNAITNKIKKPHEKETGSKRTLKQSTLNKFLCPTLKEDKEQVIDDKNSANNQGEDCFKKPELPLNQHLKQSVNKKPKANEKLATHGQHSINLETKTASQVSETTKKYLDTKKFVNNKVQTTLTNREHKKHSTIGKSERKKTRFTAPTLVSHETSQSIALKDYKVIEINEDKSNEIISKLSVDSLQKVVMTVCFREGYTLLNKPDVLIKNSHCVPSGMMFLTFQESGASNYFYLHLPDFQRNSNVENLVRLFLTKPARIVCFEAQAFFMLTMDMFQSQNTSDWHALDPLIGCWLLDPDNPPKDFTQVVLKLDMDRSLLVVNPNADKKTQACDLLPVLDLVMDILEKKLLNASLYTLFSELEMKLTPLLAVMECSSILVDIKKLHENAAKLDSKLKELLKECHRLAGHGFQLNSHQQLRHVLFEELKLDTKFNVEVKRTENGVKSTSEAVLVQLQAFHPLPRTVLQHRHLHKVKSTYVDGLLQFVRKNQEAGDNCWTIGTTWEQVGAATGRITSKNPNLQAIPKIPVFLNDGEEIHLRSVFRARDGYSFLAADFQQIEFRVFAHYTQDNTLIQVFKQGGDIFTELSRKWLGGDSADEREKTKRIVYSVMYGAGPQKLAEYLQVDAAEASSIIDNFVQKFPSVRSLPRAVVSQCRLQGYVVTLSGRRRLFPHIRSTNCKMRSYSERQAINFLIQGSAADICKAAMLDSERELKTRSLESKLLLQIHDELIWEVKNDHLLQAAKIVREAMEHHWEERLTLLVPVPVSVSSGCTLADMHSIDG